MLEPQRTLSFRAGNLLLHGMEGRNDRYWKEVITFKKPLPVEFFYHDDKADPKFYEDLDEKDLKEFPWVLDAGEAFHSWGDDIEDTFDGFYCDVLFVREWMLEGHEKHSTGLIEMLEKLKLDTFDPGCIKNEDPIGVATRVKEWFHAKVMHWYQAYFKVATFDVLSLDYEEGGKVIYRDFSEVLKIRIRKEDDGCWYFYQFKDNVWKMLFWNKDIRKGFDQLAVHLVS